MPVVLRCMAGCDTKDILAALGLTWGDLFWDKQAPLEVRERLTLQEQADALERQVGWLAVLQALEPGKRAYWFEAERRIRGELYAVRCRVDPVGMWREERERRLQEKIRRLGWERMWKEDFDGDDGTGKGKSGH
ncbi:MAG: hypothetical protein WA213_20960 [Terriglobales bacterium]